MARKLHQVSSAFIGRYSLGIFAGSLFGQAVVKGDHGASAIESKR
jgi:hypothetical protein